ncbi:contact-dependent growth inhibition system immunity protein [Providencia stuartii]|uniref:contact-dependent growth inhibition system immunity protein n=1 Tax=Providencia stuartii TaxID=588 RepID=UPI00201DBAEE|nr:contact-dependent growth inhibition system immunity protein [Providencia stuartii]UQZ13917.1 contact-dependent growth inhibition system immunity protein [Providencia stuartii]
MKPSHPEKWEGWRELDESRHVILSLDNSTEEIGAGLHLALSRCTTKEFSFNTPESVFILKNKLSDKIDN